MDGEHDSWVSNTFGVDVSSYVSKVGDAIGGAVDQVEQTASNAVSAVGNAAESAVGTVSQAVGGAVDTVEDVAKGAYHAVAGAVESVEDVGGKVVHAVGAAVGSAVDAVGSAAATVVGDVEDWFDAGPKAADVAAAAKSVNDLSDDDVKKMSAAEKVKLAKTLEKNGKLTKDAREAQKKLFRNMELDPDFKKRESERGDRIAKSLANDKDLQDTRKNWDKKSKEEKVAALKKIIAAQSKEYGFDPPEIETYDEGTHKGADGNDYITNGHFEASDGKLHINTNGDSAFSDFETVVDTALHENGHNYQARMVKDLRAGKIKPGDPDYNQATMFDVNDDDNSYIQPSEDFAAYVGQPEENHSRTMGPETASKINLALQKATK